ncbi:MAG: LysR family transcriptional regulator [Casimicrobiaceae bacterium]|nr:LysR family transcriptional regulator [Casimicrobiaceae bacterium]MDW8312897.1 LysR family transcriptional regulator [Burkholderiales bacterium]
MLERIHLELVREVARRGTLTAAAEALHLTQSALSHTVRRLEARLGMPIWQRDGKRLVPTRAGRFLEQLAERVLPQLEQGDERLRGFARGERGALRIGMECHPCYQWLQPLLRPYLLAWPDVELDVLQRFQFGGVAALVHGEIDVLVTPDPVVHEALVFEPVFDYEQVLVVAAGHRLAARRLIEPRELAAEEVVTYPVARERLDLFTQFLLPAGVLPRRQRQVEDTTVMLELVASGRAVTALPRWLIERLPAAQRRSFALVRLGRRGIRKQIHLGRRRLDVGVPYLDDFLRRATASRSAPARSR